MSLTLIGTGAEASLFVDTETERNYLVYPQKHKVWEYLYTIVDVADNKFTYNIDGVSPIEALENFLKGGYASQAHVGTWNDGESIIIDTIRRPGCDREHKLQGSDISFTVVETLTPYNWAVFENDADDAKIVKALSEQQALLEYLTLY